MNVAFSVVPFTLACKAMFISKILNNKVGTSDHVRVHVRTYVRTYVLTKNKQKNRELLIPELVFISYFLVCMKMKMK